MRFPNWLRVLPFIVLTAAAFPAISYASGAKEDRIAQAKQLIEGRQYNEAILLLADVMREEPDKFDIAQKMLDEVRAARNTYNEKYARLIDLYNQPEMDLEEAYQLFKEMEEMDKSPNQATAESFQKAKDTAVFVFNNNRFRRIMEEALRELAAFEYWEAVETYLTGLTLMEEEFSISGYGTLVDDRAARLKREIRTAGESFIASKDNLTRLSGRREEVFAADDDNSVRVFMGEIFSFLPELAALRKEAFAAANDIQTQNTIIKEQREKEAFHLTFIYLLIMGRNESRTEGGTPEGIIHAMDAPWAQIAEAVESDVVLFANTFIDSGIERYTQGDYSGAAQNLSRGGIYAAYVSRMAGLWGTTVYLEDDFGIPAEDGRIVRTKAERVLLSAAQGAAAETLLSLTTDLEAAAAYDFGVNAMQLRDNFSAIRGDLVRIQESFAAFVQGWDERTARLSSLTDSGWNVTGGSDIAGRVRSIGANGLSKAVITEERVAAKEAELTQRLLLARFEEESENVRRAERILTGIEKPVPTGEDGEVYLSKDPTGARMLLSAHETALRQISADNDILLSRLQAERPELKAGPYLQERIEQGENLKTRVAGLATSVAAYLARAEEQIALADRLKAEANLRLQESENALRNQNFDGARARLQTAGERFDASLAIQDDPALRGERDDRIASIGQRIAFEENELIVREVRALITEGKRFYTAENYEAAERVLTQALSRWRVTNPSNDNAELDYWLNIVRVALYMRSGRIIAQTDPLYRDMSSLLNLARESYLKGKDLVEKGRRAEALPYFEDAEKKILLIKIPFPVNQEASVLSLRVLQYRDLANFANLFRQKYNEAIAKMDRDTQNAYIELKDLEAINPNYPGMANAIYNAELKLGIRVPPPDPTKRLRSDEWYARALDIVQRNIRAQFPIALEYLGEAIRLTPEEQKVINLLDRVTSNIGGRSTIVLTNVAQQQYRQAEDAYIAGNFYEALRIVNNLMKDQKNTQYPPLIELKRRIESKI